MSAPPFANLFAAGHPDASVLDSLAVELERGGDFSEVWRPASGWVVASAPLPRGEVDGASVRAHQLAFAEGREATVNGAGDNRDSLFGNIATLTQTSPERLAVLPGDFGFIHFRPAGAATVVRSCAGLAPFYLCFSGALTVIGTSLNYFVRYLDVEPKIDPLVTAIWSAGWGIFPDRRTFLQNVSLVPRGHFARIERGKAATMSRYWNPRPKQLTNPTPARRREHAERLRDILVTKLAHDLDPEGGNLLTLSGGIDSSALGALAAGVVGRKVWTWSYLPEPEALYQEAMAYITPLANRFGFERSWTVRYNDRTRIGLSAVAPSVVFPVIHPALCALPGLQSEADVRVVFGGEFADDICGSIYRIADLLAHTSFFQLVQGLGEPPFGPRLLLSWTKHRCLSWIGRSKPRLPFLDELPELFCSELRAEYLAWLERRRTEAAADAGPCRSLALRLEMDGWVDMNWAVTTALGIRRSIPFFNREIVELAFECHPVELMGPGPKMLLRNALHHDVPAKNLCRPDKGNWGGNSGNHLVAWETCLPANLQPLIRPDWFPTTPGQIKRMDADMLSRLLNFLISLSTWRSRRGAG